MHSYTRFTSLMVKRRCLLRNTVAVGGLFSALLVTREEETKIENKTNIQMEQGVSPNEVITNALLPSDILGGVTACDFDSQAPTTRKMEESSTRKKLRSMYNVKWKRPLGEGGFGAVYLGREKKTGDLGKYDLSINRSFLLGKTQDVF